MYSQLVIMETFMDLQAYVVKTKAWLKGLWKQGLVGAHQAAAGLDY